MVLSPNHRDSLRHVLDPSFGDVPLFLIVNGKNAQPSFATSGFTCLSGRNSPILQNFVIHLVSHVHQPSGKSKLKGTNVQNLRHAMERNHRRDVETSQGNAIADIVLQAQKS